MSDGREARRLLNFALPVLGPLSVSAISLPALHFAHYNFVRQHKILRIADQAGGRIMGLFYDDGRTHHRMELANDLKCALLRKSDHIILAVLLNALVA